MKKKGTEAVPEANKTSKVVDTPKDAKPSAKEDLPAESDRKKQEAAKLDVSKKESNEEPIGLKKECWFLRLWHSTRLKAIIWLAVTIIVSIFMALLVNGVYTGLYSEQQEAIAVHSFFGLALTAFFSFGTYYIHHQSSKPHGWATFKDIFLMFLIVLFVLFVPLWFAPNLDNIEKIDDLFRLVTVCFAILAADCAIPSLAKKKDENQERDLLAMSSFFLVGTCAAATLVLTLFAKNDPESIVFVGRLCVFYCLGCLLFTIVHFLYVFPFLKNLSLIFSDAFGPKKK